jgi:3-hydroxyisobutyrate dehydrogenase
VQGASHRVEDCDAVLSCVTNEAAQERLAFDEVLPKLRRDALFMDHTTTSATLARRIAAACAERGAGFVDAPLSGGVEGARAGTLVAMAGGSAADYERAQPLLACYTARRVHIGAAGAGQLAKMANQIAIAGTLQALAEGVMLARANGISPAAVLEALAGGAANSAQLARERGKLESPEFHFAEAFGWLAKDLDLALKDAGLKLPLAQLVKDSLAR